MTNSTAAGKNANMLLKEAARLERLGLAETHSQALDNRQHAAQYRKLARIEDLSVREVALRKKAKNGEVREYRRWIASWRVGGRIVTKYLGSSQGKNAIGETEALERARKLKMESLKGAED